MNDLRTTSKNTVLGKKFSPLSRGLVLWFLLLSLLPLIAVSWVGYQTANKSLTQSAADKLQQSAVLSVHFIKNWFEYRFMDLNSQAESQSNAKFLSALQEGWQASNKSLDKYVKSYPWVMQVDGAQHDLVTFSRGYDYIYDLFLIDTEGNILYSVAQESDLGTNLLNGPYARTRFAHSVKQTLETGEAKFSDLERYAPSNDIIAGFLTAPLLDEFGGKLGVFAIQIRFDRVLNLLNQKVSSNSSLKHYLVGDDGKLRTTFSGSKDEILKTVINSEQFNLWYAEHGQSAQLDDQEEAAFTYMGPIGNQVIGIHHMLRLLGTEWVLISEIDETEALAEAAWIGKLTSILVFLTILIVVAIAIFQARRITRPIRVLVDASMAVAAGERDQQVDVVERNEIGQLAEAFNHMLKKRQMHEQALILSNDKTQRVLTDLEEQKFALDQHAIVAITDVQGNITFTNKKFSEISGYSRDELLGQNHRMLNSGFHDTSFFRDMYRTIAKGEVWHDEVCNKSKDGHFYWVDTTIVPFMDDDGKPKSYIAIRADITERKQAELELVQAKEAAEDASQLKSEFLANMSHEIRTPMNGVIGMTGLLLDTELEPKQREYAEASMKSADALLTIINDILDFSKIEAGKLELESVPFDLQTLSEDVAEMMAVKCREKGVEMLLRYKPDTQHLLLGGPGRIRQILLNLLSNAIKFTERGMVLLTIESQGFLNNETTILVHVEDSGIGIAEDKLDSIFNKFDQEDGSTTRKYGGTGLGLAICRQLCELMQGEISVESKKGKGSTFSFTMKLKVANESTTAPAQPESFEHLKGLKILVVDDLDAARVILTEQLSVLQIRVETASSARQALDILSQAVTEQDPVDIVITDFQMPEMDGEMLAVEINQQGLLQNGALLYVTSSPRKGDGQRLSKMGFDGYLTKPTHPTELPQILSLIWHAKQQGHDIPLVSRHTLRDVKSGSREKIILTDTHILLAEDNPVNRMVATEYLEAYGCSITPAGNGLEALAMIKEQQFDLVFMDCQMPEMDGFEATAEIRMYESDNFKLNHSKSDHSKPNQVIQRVPIIAFTANAMQGDKEKCLDAGMDDYISKPVNQKALKNVLAKWLPHKSQIIAGRVEQDTSPENHQECIAPAVVSNVDLNLEAFNELKQLFKDKFSSAIERHTVTAQDNVKRALEAIQQRDLETLERIAHSLKGSSAQFGALELNRLSTEMEQLAKIGELEKARKLFTELRTAQEHVAQRMLREVS